MFSFGDTRKRSFEWGECVASKVEFQGKKPPDEGLEKSSQPKVDLIVAMEGFVKDIEQSQNQITSGVSSPLMVEVVDENSNQDVGISC